MSNMERVIAAGSWLWVATMLAAYVYQYLDLLGPIMRALGLA